MRTFAITVERKITLTHRIYIEAKNHTAAMREAEKRATDYGDSTAETTISVWRARKS